MREETLPTILVGLVGMGFSYYLATLAIHWWNLALINFEPTILTYILEGSFLIICLLTFCLGAYRILKELALVVK